MSVLYDKLTSKSVTAVLVAAAMLLLGWGAIEPPVERDRSLSGAQASYASHERAGGRDGSSEAGARFSLSKNIEEIEVGDLVWSFNEDTLQFEQRRVTALLHSTTDHTRVLTLLNQEKTQQRIHTTDEHPFYVLGRGWTEAKGLESGDTLLTADAGEVTLLASLRQEHPDGIPVYNFEVEGLHNYFVASSDDAEAVLAHNKCRRVNGNRRLARRPQHGYVIKRNGQVYKYGVSGGKVSKANKSYRAEKQKRKLERDNSGDRWETEILQHEPNRARILDWEQGMVNDYASNNGRQGPPGNRLPQPTN